MFFLLLLRCPASLSQSGVVVWFNHGNSLITAAGFVFLINVFFSLKGSSIVGFVVMFQKS
jgi:hypothetical protein